LSLLKEDSFHFYYYTFNIELQIGKGTGKLF